MYDARIKRLLARVQQEGLDALLITALPNIYYVSGFTGSTAIVLLTPEHRWFLTDFRYHEQFKAQVDPSFELFDNSGKKLLDEVLPELPNQEALKRIGFESMDVRHVLYAKMQEHEGREFVPTKEWVAELRMIKDDVEIGRLRESVRLNERVFIETLDAIQPGATEADLAAEIYYRAMKYGASALSFDPIIASGTNSAKPHAGFTKSKLVPNAPLTIDMGLILDGYCSDMTRTVFIKDCPKEWQEVYAVVQEAKELAFAAIKPGKTGREIDAIAREHIYSAGFAGKFEHGLGHGVGIEVHESPRLAKSEERTLVAGHVVTDEPGIYLPGEGGVRIEDMIVVTDSGAENLNTLDTDLLVI